ncbi:YozE family protein [Weissella minor]|uniref:YozE family protein n=1 Tax=Weissella minor TaxID=1620 RepID=UPI001BB06AC4|nr:YozE family protein [Weissella minor]MBS0949307.1 YozE family protein [Weissella minor]
MRRSFYSWLMTQRNPVAANEVQTFANGAFYDQQFPKQSDDFDEISRHLEENASYLHSVTIFDEAWDEYLASEN